MPPRGPVPLEPTYCRGYLSSTADALVLIEACLQGQLNHVPRRPQDRERADLVQSGNIFIYEENASGIKRWTDGVNWSPSRILGNFLIYRELDKPFEPGQKKRALKGKHRKTPANGVSKNRSSHSPPGGSVMVGGTGLNKELERSLIGSLVDSYPFKLEGGLVKKTISVHYRGVLHHVVSYYTVEDVVNRQLGNPSEARELLPACAPRLELTARQNFRVPLEPNPVLYLNQPPMMYPHHHDGQMPMQPMQGGHMGYRQMQMPGMPQGIPQGIPQAMPQGMAFPNQGDLAWQQMGFLDGGLQNHGQPALGNLPYEHNTHPEEGMLPPFDDDGSGPYMYNPNHNVPSST